MAQPWLRRQKRLTYSLRGISDITKVNGVVAALALDPARAGHAAYYFGSRSSSRHNYCGLSTFLFGISFRRYLSSVLVRFRS
jgi:hypothetical protein